MLLKSSGEPNLARFWGKYQVQLQKVIDIRWVSLREPSPYYTHWPVKYHIACEHAQQNDAIWEDVTPHPQMTPILALRERTSLQPGSDNTELSPLFLFLWWSMNLGKGIPSNTDGPLRSKVVHIQCSVFNWPLPTLYLIWSGNLF